MYSIYVVCRYYVEGDLLTWWTTKPWEYAGALLFRMKSNYAYNLGNETLTLFWVEGSDSLVSL